MFHLRDKNLDINRISQITFPETVCGYVLRLGLSDKGYPGFHQLCFSLLFNVADKMRVCWTQNIALTP